MTTRYEHTQYGRLIMVALMTIAIAVTVGTLGTEVWYLAPILLSFFCLLTIMFGWLRVTVDDELLTARFGFGLIRRRIKVADIAAAEPVRNKWWYGLGVRLTPYGWMFNIGGLDAVEVTFRNGRRFRIGTDQPEQLTVAIRAAMREATAKAS